MTDALIEHRGKTIKNQAVVLDGNSYLNCKIENCHITYSGGLFHLVDCDIENPTWHFHGAAGHTLLLMRELARNDPEFVRVSLQSEIPIHLES